ncbi:MAG: hypothetical protein QME64_13240 [bacterium]|nr:hypothetical protein [bacterium]
MLKKIIISNLMLGCILATLGWAIENGDFEYGVPSPWNTYGTGVANVEFGTARTGDYCAKLFIGGVSQYAGIYQAESAAAVGETWKVEGWAKRIGGSCVFGWYDGPQVTVTSGSWTKITDTITFGSGATKEVDFYLSGTMGSSAYLDDVITYKVIISDTTSPSWSTTTGVINVTNPAPGQIEVSWGVATDALSPPVTFNLYRNTSMPASAGLKFANVTSPYTFTGLVAGRTYYFTVRAQDSATPPNETTNEDNRSIFLPTGVTNRLWELYQ